MGAKVGRDDFGVRTFEQAPEPAHPLAWVVGHPELLDRGRDFESERERTAPDRPGEGTADVVLLGDRDLEVLPARGELAGVEVRALGDSKEELCVSLVDLLSLRRLFETLACVFADRVE